VGKQENLKKSIQTILDQFPQHIVKYTEEEQQIISFFLEAIEKYEEAEYNRPKLIARFRKYINKTRKEKTIFEIHFLSLGVRVSENAIYRLSTAGYSPISFYNSLLHQLRPIFLLIRQNEPLSSQKFLERQYSSEDPDPPLTTEEHSLLNLTYSILQAEGIDSLNSNTLRTEIGKEGKISPKLKTETELIRYYTLVEGRWWIHFYSPAFGLTQVFFHIICHQNAPVETILGYTDEINTVLCASDIHEVIGAEKEYVGNLYIPNKDLTQLKTYLNQCEEKNQIQLKTCQTIVNKRRSISLENYKEGEGWINLTRKKEQELEEMFSTPNSDKILMERNLHFFTPPETPKWEYSTQDEARKIIQLYCRLPTEYAYPHLPLNITPLPPEINLSRQEKTLLRLFHREKVIDIGFVPWRLIDSYSLVRYLIKTPQLTKKQLIQFLNVLPIVEVYFVNNQHLLWVVLQPPMVQWIKQTLKWPILPVQRIHHFTDLKAKWFDANTLQWMTPRILLT
jgi:hypothetical protein